MVPEDILSSGLYSERVAASNDARGYNVLGAFVMMDARRRQMVPEDIMSSGFRFDERTAASNGAPGYIVLGAFVLMDARRRRMVPEDIFSSGLSSGRAAASNRHMMRTMSPAAALQLQKLE